MVRNILFAWMRPAPPFFIGGAEISQQLLAEKFVQTGYHVTYLGTHTSIRSDDKGRLAKYTKYLGDTGIPYDVRSMTLSYTYKTIKCVMPEAKDFMLALEREVKNKPLLVFTAQEYSDDIASYCHSRQIRTVGWIHSTSEVGTAVVKAQPTHALCTSSYVLDKVKTIYAGDAHLFYPPFVHQNPSRRKPEFITLFNPIPEKGVSTFLKLAARYPTQKFLAVETWRPVRLPSSKYPNISYIQRRMNTESIYAKTKLLLAPSLQEGFGRVVVEAGLQAIPSITSHVGGLPEAVGGGGILIKGDDIEKWSDAVEQLERKKELQNFSHQAYTHARNFLIDPVHKLQKLRIL
jgi:glycosyltransferase involved in cell wall biosynthesis